MSRLRELYKEQVAPALMERFGYKSVMQVPRLDKVVLNMGVGEAVQDSKALEGAVRDLTVISGQKPAVTRAKRSISNFKIRAGMPIGCKVTLRGERMYDFVDKLIHAALPRIRDFNGLSPDGFDGRGNYSLGLSEQLIFPEIRYDDIDRVRGLDITVVTTAQSDEEALELLRQLGFPMRSRAA
ncbi:50S ribosomal protein L5 [Limnochorda pilosa]|uniref:Large ribosomal subunit protein uL5 n=1 Tax=Limnochorda pilosa TaxID=1555112 RepID=A0A0K2SPQ2_LIMPI|nr:50S ribosomal protein L5 [Limnochorda pilosa]BAS29076.1 50S ribosomal protein L5 [Limnochorda pilosa]